MTTWVLILALSGQGQAIDHIGFDYKSNCMAAAKEFKAQFTGWGTPPKAICVEDRHD